MRVVLSYASPDAAFAGSLGESMQALGVDVDDPSRLLRPGTSWREAIRDALERSDAVLLVAPTRGAPGANNAFFEVGAASALGKQILVVIPKMDEVAGREFPADLRGTAVVQASGRTADAIAETLMTTLKRAA